MGRLLGNAREGHEVKPSESYDFSLLELLLAPDYDVLKCSYPEMLPFPAVSLLFHTIFVTRDHPVSVCRGIFPEGVKVWVMAIAYT